MVCGGPIVGFWKDLRSKVDGYEGLHAPNLRPKAPKPTVAKLPLPQTNVELHIADCLKDSSLPKGPFQVPCHFAKLNCATP